MKNGPYVLTIAPDSYPGKKYRGRYCYEHHLVFWEWTDQVIPEGYQLHHKNKNTRDNRPENLELVTSVEHGSRHVALPNTICPECGKEFHVQPYKLGRKFPPLCSRKCIGKVSGRGRPRKY